MSHLLPHPGLAPDSLECVYQPIHLGGGRSLWHKKSPYDCRGSHVIRGDLGYTDYRSHSHLSYTHPDACYATSLRVSRTFGPRRVSELRRSMIASRSPTR